MVTKTEKLREKIAKFLYHYRAITRRAKKDIVPWGKLNETYKNTYREDANYYLQACKEAGLKFVPEHWELEQGVHWAHTIQAINSQIEEISGDNK